MGPGSSDTVDAEWRHFETLELTPILEAALEVFYEHGFHGTTVRELARRVGLTVPALYYHYENKEGILVALLEMSTGDLSWRVRAAAEAAGASPEARLANVIEAIALHMTLRSRLAALDSETRHLSADNRKRYAMRRKEIENLMFEIVESGAYAGTFVAPEPVETARALLGMCQSIARWYHPGGALSPHEVAERYVDIALRTVGSRKASRTKR
ncbi:TetR/AcrR family transcriptional regulator [Nocardia sp. NPDC052112]|uniref:TetR/AcrR family transcriptional regulator n=1 Tax=Nocardia sp. NPDC052112 TaxID=3155646 RepID=UPI00343FC3D0